MSSSLYSHGIRVILTFTCALMEDLLNLDHFLSNVHVLSYVTLKLNKQLLGLKTQFKSLLSSLKLLGFVNGAIAPPPTTQTIVLETVNVDEKNPQLE